jgi:hypothetical protein
MTHHKYKIGQFVNYSPSRLGVPPAATGYEVIRLLPTEGGDILYRIKSRSEAFERIAKEQDLSRRDPPA